jgi:hypothetical protein
VVAQDIVEREMEERKRRLAEERYWALKAEEAVLRQRAEAAIRAMEAERELRVGLIRLDTRGADTDLSHRRSPTRAPTRLQQRTTSSDDSGASRDAMPTVNNSTSLLRPGSFKSAATSPGTARTSASTRTSESGGGGAFQHIRQQALLNAVLREVSNLGNPLASMEGCSMGESARGVRQDEPWSPRSETSSMRALSRVDGKNRTWRPR